MRVWILFLLLFGQTPGWTSAPCSELGRVEERLDVNAFRPNATQRRTSRRGDQLLTVRIGAPAVDANRVRLFNLHQHEPKK